jgi:hypothetical protein
MECFFVFGFGLPAAAVCALIALKPAADDGALLRRGRRAVWGITGLFLFVLVFVLSLSTSMGSWELLPRGLGTVLVRSPRTRRGARVARVLVVCFISERYWLVI